MFYVIFGCLVVMNIFYLYIFLIIFVFSSNKKTKCEYMNQ